MISAYQIVQALFTGEHLITGLRFNCFRTCADFRRVKFIINLLFRKPSAALPQLLRHLLIVADLGVPGRNKKKLNEPPADNVPVNYQPVCNEGHMAYVSLW